MYQIILMLHMIVALFIILLVLVQQGKGAVTGAAFGSGASQTVFGSRGSGSFLLKLTIGCVAIFFTTSITLNYMATREMKREKHSLLPVSLPSVPTTAPTTVSNPPNIPEAALPDQHKNSNPGKP